MACRSNAGARDLAAKLAGARKAAEYASNFFQFRELDHAAQIFLTKAGAVFLKPIVVAGRK